MAISWKLQEALKDANITSISQLQKALIGKMGIRISRAALHKLIHRQPSAIKLGTAQILCTLLQVPFENILSISPEPIIREAGGLYQPYSGSKQYITSSIPDPSKFL